MAEYVFTINGYDVLPCIAEGGLTQTEVYRQQTTVVGLDGTLYQSEVVKRSLTVAFLPITGERWAAILQALESRPAVVKYVDDTRGERSAYFFVKSLSAGTQQRRGGITWINSATVTLEER